MKTLMMITAGFFLVGMNSCFYDKADLIYPQPTTCDTATVTYSGTVAPILNASCNGCHGGAAAAGAGIKLDTYAGVTPWVTNGRLLNSMLHNGQASPMPKGGSKLDACTLNKISAWITKGAANN
jgi:mono/diheme cytochrome c family protein